MTELIALTADPQMGFQVPAKLKPKVINYQVNDICNARCVMCNIWQRARSPELNPEEFRKLLSDDFFSDVQHIGITGGEPTLRRDLDQFYEAALEVLPNLMGGHFITNGFSPNRALEIYRNVHASYTSRRVLFGGMVSIDGVGPIHNHVRGRQSAFERASGTLFAIRDAGIAVIACCTIVKENVYGLHDLLDWATKNKIELRFRVAEFIDRLYVDKSNPQIRSFTGSEIKHLVAFFHHLIYFYEKNEDVRRTYQSILSLLMGGERLTGCPYQTPTAISIDCEGRFAHCAPHGKLHVLGSEPALQVMRFESERSTLIDQHCAHCIHDYHSDWSQKEIAVRSLNNLADNQLYGQPVDLTTIAESACEFVKPGSLQKIVLVGWYGTETAGDIAILAGIVRQYVANHPSIRFTLFSLFPRYTAVTIGDLPLDFASRITVVDYSSNSARVAADEADALVMAGGPLMDIPQTAMIASLFARFAKRGKPRVIEGCGIGPLNVDEFRDNVVAIARLATEISVRDQDSAKRLREFGIKKRIVVRADPAYDYVKSLGITWKSSESAVIRCFLRELTHEYPQATDPAKAEQIVIDFLKRLLKTYPFARIELLAMHYFPIGNDDRLYARKIVAAIADPRITIPMQPLSPREILEQMAESMFCIAMRFHSVVFAHTIGVPFIAIDYTGGGKIFGFLHDAGEMQRCFDFAELETIGVDVIESLVSANVKTGSTTR